MSSFYNFKENGFDYSFDDIFLPADLFRYGNLWTWGINDSAQHGVNDGVARSTPSIATGGPQWKQMSNGGDHMAAIKTDGTLWVWGNNGNGRLGTNDNNVRSTPVTTFAGGNNWKQVSAKGGATFAVKTDGTLWGWGNNQLSVLGINDTTNRSTPVTTFAGGNNWAQVAQGLGSIAAIKTDGTLWTWGSNSYARLGVNDANNRSTPVTTFAGGNNWKQVSVGQGGVSAVKTDGTLWSWGSLTGNVGSDVRSTPTTTFLGGNNWKEVDCGSGHVSAIKTDGTLWMWGLGSYGRLGTNDVNDRGTPVTTFLGGTNWKRPGAASQCSYAIKTDGTLWVWGRNDPIRLGTNDNLHKSTPVTTFVGGTNWLQVSIGFETVQTEPAAAALTYDTFVI